MQIVINNNFLAIKKKITQNLVNNLFNYIFNK